MTPIPTSSLSRRLGEALAHFVRQRLGIRTVRWGYNPNSSSLGVNTSLLLYGALMLAALAPLMAALVRVAVAVSGGGRALGARAGMLASESDGMDASPPGSAPSVSGGG